MLYFFLRIGMICVRLFPYIRTSHVTAGTLTTASIQVNHRAQRIAEAKPLLDSLRQWFEATLSKLSRKSEATVAIRYALSHWDALLRYIEDGHIEIDNNPAERSLRGVALGRKNYLFAGSNRGGECAAAIYSLIGSAKLNGLDPEALTCLRLTIRNVFLFFLYVKCGAFDRL